jgi:hypothetical protein
VTLLNLRGNENNVLHSKTTDYARRSFHPNDSRRYQRYGSDSGSRRQFIKQLDKQGGDN